jgi:hypothetical protein
LEENRSDRQLPERGVIDILSETFAIYWRHFASFVALTAVIYVPIGFLELALTLVARESVWVTLSMTVLDSVFSIFVYAAGIFAVGQHYLVNRVTVGESYTRALLRVVSLAVFAIALGILLSLVMSAVFTVSDPALTVETQEAAEPEITASVLIALAVMFLALPVLLIYSIYLVVIMPALIVEGRHARSALQRSIELTRNSKWRIFGHLVVYSLVTIGLLIALNTPLFILGEASPAGETPSLWTSLIGVVISRAGSILIAPVTFIATTLLYYDLRIRKENYDIPRLSLEMGIART